MSSESELLDSAAMCSKTTPSSAPVPCFRTISRRAAAAGTAACSARRPASLTSSDRDPESRPASISARASVRPPIAGNASRRRDARSVRNAAARSSGVGITTVSIHGRARSASRIAAAAARARVIDDHAQLGHVEHQAGVERNAAQRGDDLRRMPRQAQRRAQRDELRVPDREHEVAAAERFGARQHRVGRDARQPLVDQMLVGLAAAEASTDSRRRCCRRATARTRGWSTADRCDADGERIESRRRSARATRHCRSRSLIARLSRSSGVDLPRLQRRGARPPRSSVAANASNSSIRNLQSAI